MQRQQPEYLTTEEVASVLRVTAVTIERLTRTEGLPCVRVTRSTARYPRCEFEQWACR
jgi:excisionase family DNA binding protein